MTDTETVIACDESGSEGENLTGAAHRVFVHASTDLTVDEATAVMHGARERAPTQAAELKAEHLLARPDAVGWFLAAGGPLDGRAVAHLVDKQYFVIGKVVDLLVEEVTHAAGIDLYAGGRARKMAWDLHRNGPRAFRTGDWDGLLAAFNSLMRAKQRKGAKTTVDEFFAAVDRLRLVSRRRVVAEVIDVVWTGRVHAEDFQELLAEAPDHPPALDPLIAALAQTARAWSRRTGRPVRVVHDQQAVLTPPRIQSLIDLLWTPHPDLAAYAPRVRVSAIELVDSKDDPRVQVADLLAGTARHLATAALTRAPEHDRAAKLRPFTDPDSLWSDDLSWAVLTDRPSVGR
ncbi:MAG: DUF3800 domain-containing protein [Actinomycetota bacterium]|nr:DUF3800 domain-containing protein [Actinomycetota bacterium]